MLSHFDKNLSDNQLIESLLNNDETAILYFFYEKFYSVFEYHVYRIFPYEQSVQELVHEFFLYLRQDNWRRLRSYNSELSQLNTWVSVVSFRFFQNFKKSKIDSNGLITIYEQWDDKILQYKQACVEQVRMDVSKAIESLKNKTEREVARELLLEETDVQEVAKTYNLSVDYTYTVKSRAVAHLRKILKDYRS
ncbi:MAG: sigma-70 family RNA polymerase sigma factor [Bacteroidales bacterium]|nr:sigma-70 family RNA polymerase sigma factor [Bacteroidales bacterium]